jgi:hypothetical protein
VKALFIQVGEAFLVCEYGELAALEIVAPLVYSNKDGEVLLLIGE